GGARGVQAETTGADLIGQFDTAGALAGHCTLLHWVGYTTYVCAAARLPHHQGGPRSGRPGARCGPGPDGVRRRGQHLLVPCRASDRDLVGAAQLVGQPDERVRLRQLDLVTSLPGAAVVLAQNGGSLGGERVAGQDRKIAHATPYAGTCARAQPATWAVRCAG